MAVLIGNGTLILPDGPRRADLRVENGKIAKIRPHLPKEGCEIIDAGGKLVFPGFIDTHTHFEMNKGLPNETADDFASGTKAALAGGTTCVVDFATQDRGDTLAHALEMWHSRADGYCSCHYGFHMAVTDWNERTRSELAAMGNEGVTSYKIYMAYDALRLSDGDAYELACAVGKGGIVGCHCENGDLVNAGVMAQKAAGHFGPSAHPASRPPAVEAEAVSRWLAIGELAGCPVNIVHLSTRRGLEMVRAARKRGQKVYVESCPQYFLLDESRYRLPGFESAKYVLSPPLRKPEDAEALWEALAAGEIDTVGTDHCSFRYDGVKTLGSDDFSKIPNGIPGVEHRALLMYTYGVAAGRISLGDFVRVLAENPAKLFGLYPRKGVLSEGSDGDIVIFDPNMTDCITAKAQYQNVDYTPYEGMKVQGRVETVLLMGRTVVHNGVPAVTGQGCYVYRDAPGFWR